MEGTEEEKEEVEERGRDDEGGCNFSSFFCVSSNEEENEKEAEREGRKEEAIEVKE